MLFRSVQAWKNVGQPTARVASPVTLQSGAIATPTKNGTIITRLPNGKTTTAKMPVGQPFVFSDGSSVINNGNGTITNISGNGISTVSSIGSTGTGGVGVFAALGMGLLLLSESH